MKIIDHSNSSELETYENDLIRDNNDDNNNSVGRLINDNIINDNEVVYENDKDINEGGSQ